MFNLETITETLATAVPLLASVSLAVLLVLGGRFLLLRRRHVGPVLEFAGQVWTLLGIAVVLVVAVLSAPVEAETRGQLLSLLGLTLTAIFTLSSTTFVANAMAGLMLRAVASFRPGDFIRVGGQFGRVTEVGLFHTELQTRDRDLATLPNLHLVNQPVTVVSSSGTIVSADVSLGFDISHDRVESLLCQAAQSAGLDEPFVHVIELGDFSVHYRVAGFLEDTRTLLTTRSDLREQMLDSLHRADIEIVSPTFMNQRVLPTEQRFIPNEKPKPRAADPRAPEDRIFDKAEEAGRQEDLREELEEIEAEIRQLEEQLPGLEGGDRYRLERSIALRKRRTNEIEALRATSGGTDKEDS
ncbi:MAG: mechanosensitive ion channel [bacterium]|nr:mechanosensitive ion channel [bacterium]